MEKGKTNNPKGRPKGRTNKVSAATRELLEKFVSENFDTIMQDLKKLKPRDRVNAFISLLKYLIPPAHDKETEQETKDAVNNLITRLFHKEEDSS